MPKQKKPAQPEAVVVEHTARAFEMSALDLALREAGLPVKGIRSQSKLSYERGYARVEIYGSYDHTSALGWREVPEADAAWSVQGTPERFHLDGDSWWTDLVSWMADILRTGRTVACGQGIGYAERSRRYPRFGSLSYPWQIIQKMVDGTYIERLDLNPDYQRGAVWSRQQQREFVGFLLDGGESPKIVVQRYESNRHAPPGADYTTLPSEVIDGQQRLRAICDWMRGEFDALTPDGDSLWFRDANEIDRRGLVLLLHYVDLPRVDRLRLYIKLNRGGTAHTEQDIDRARALLAAEEQRADV